MMNELLVDYNTIESEIDVQDLEPQVGKIKINEHRQAFDAVYLQDASERIIAYITFKPYWGDERTVEVESFTNEAVRKKGVQKRLNQKLLDLLSERNVEAIVGQIQIDNSPSLLNRTKVKSVDGKGVLKAEALNIDWVEEKLVNGEKIQPFTLKLKVYLNEVVADNEELLSRIRTIQDSLTENRYGSSV